MKASRHKRRFGKPSSIHRQRRSRSHYSIHIYQGFSRVRGVSKCRGSGRVGSIVFKISRVGSGRVKIKKISRVGSGRVRSGGVQNATGRVGSSPVRYGSFAGQVIMTREFFPTDPHVRPAGLAHGSVFLLTCAAACRKVAFVTRGSGIVQQNILAVSRPKASLVPIRRPPRA